MAPVNDDEFVIDDPLCHCGSTFTVRRRTVGTWEGGIVGFEAWCTDHPGQGHPVPEHIKEFVADLDSRFGKG